MLQKQTLTVYFYLSTQPSEEIGFCPEGDSGQPMFRMGVSKGKIHDKCLFL